MSLIDGTCDNTAIEECIEELAELLMSLDGHEPAAVAAAMATHLEGLLGALIEEGQCTAMDVRELLRRIESSVLRDEPGAAPR